MQTAYWVMVMMMVWIAAPLSEGGKLNDVIRGLVPDDITPQLILGSLISRRQSEEGGSNATKKPYILRASDQVASGP
uniref:Contulakin-G n=2 Tax=Conus geographus TaxID=6491 RepID=CONG_CONGE|nr:RecName: Full=Contulakin-G; AltName: Full=CGX-1160; Flags: Precursor [Conus geographus]AAD30031.1 contulakin-G [Conus geographus]BAO65574.1 G041_VD_Contulakin_precursor_conopeptide [Conus geographus]